jgi:hypothetical protein
VFVARARPILEMPSKSGVLVYINNLNSPENHFIHVFYHASTSFPHQCCNMLFYKN